MRIVYKLLQVLANEANADSQEPDELDRRTANAERIVRVPIECAKTGVGRIIEGLPDALWHWLDAYPPAGDFASVVSAAKAADRARRLAGMDEWPHDAIRHTFATYAVAFTGDAARVSLWLGHEGNASLIHRHYRGLATKAQAEAFFALRPS